jgi:hypothetical protein
MVRHRISRVLVALACGGMLLPHSVASADEPAIAPAKVNAALAIEDVALGADQSFHGMLLSEDGKSVVGAEVTISQLGKEVARATTDESGRFAFQGLRGGLHLVRAGQGAGLYRFWAAGTAPPNARPSVTMVDQITVRGQRPFREFFTSNAVILTAIVVAAVAIPIAVHDARNDRSGS